MDQESEDLFSQIVNELYMADANYAIIGTDFELDLQGSSSSKYDNAKRPLFSFFNEELLERPTYKTFLALMDNYISGTGQNEELNREEVQENIDFINAITETDLMNKFFDLLVEKELFDGDYNGLKRKMYTIWFRLYSRNYESRREGILDSSAFEHTFVGEVKNTGSPMGFHNWLRLYTLEKAGELDYEGHVRKAERNIMAQVRFNWQGCDKVSSIFLGTSPEFEMAVYSLALVFAKKFELEEVKIPFEIEGEQYAIQVYNKYKWSEKHQCKKIQLESAFPTAEF